MDKDACGTCRNKNRCIERSRMYPCLSYKKKKGPAQRQLWQAQKLKINTLYYEGEQEKNQW